MPTFGPARIGDLVMQVSRIFLLALMLVASTKGHASDGREAISIDLDVVSASTVRCNANSKALEYFSCRVIAAADQSRLQLDRSGYNIPYLDRVGKMRALVGIEGMNLIQALLAGDRSDADPWLAGTSDAQQLSSCSTHSTEGCLDFFSRIMKESGIENRKVLVRYLTEKLERREHVNVEIFYGGKWHMLDVINGVAFNSERKLMFLSASEALEARAGMPNVNMAGIWIERYKKPDDWKNIYKGFYSFETIL